MAEYTDNFNLIKPGQDEFYNVEIFNNNADIIDAELKNLKNTIENLNADGITLPDGKTISEKFSEITKEIGNTEELDTETKLSLVAAINEINQALVAHKAENTTDAHLPKNVGLGNVLNIKQVQIIETKLSLSGDVVFDLPMEPGVYFCVAMGNSGNTPQIFEMFYQKQRRVSIIEPKNATIVFDKINNTITISPTGSGWTTYSIVKLY